MKTTHTPWHTSRLGKNTFILSPTGFVIASIPDSGPYSAKVKAKNAAAIVHAVNHFDEVLAALKDLTDAYLNAANSGKDCGCDWDANADPAYVAARAAIASATQEN